MTSFLKNNKVLILIIVAGFILRLAFILYGAEFYYGKENFYKGGDTPAFRISIVNFIETGTYTLNETEYGPFGRMPGYPFYMGVFYYLSGGDWDSAYMMIGWSQMFIDVLVILLFKIACLKSTSYQVTPDRIEWSRGILNRHVDNLDMFRIIDLKMRRSLIDCLLGIGTVILTTKDESDPEFAFVKVRGCRQLYDVIKKAGLEADKVRNVIHVE